MKMIVIEDARSRIERHPNPDDAWLWCMLCRRFFQYKNALPSGQYPHDACPFRDCQGYGLGCDLLWWDDTREPDDPRWPKSTDELEHGLKSPDMEPFYAAQLTARIHHTVSAFARSRELEISLGGQPPCYLSSFLQMMSDLCWDLTEDDDFGFAPDLAEETIGELPVWSRCADPGEAPRMAAELRAFFAFAARTDAVADAASWCDFVAGHDLEGKFRHTMRTDRRLQQPVRSRPCRRRKRKRRKQRRR